MCRALVHFCVYVVQMLEWGEEINALKELLTVCDVH